MIRAGLPSVADWLDACCWRCGSPLAGPEAGGRRLCEPCRREVLAEPVVDALALARHAYWETHALRCCWRCMAGAVDPADDVGMCASCRRDLVRQTEGAA